MYKEFAYVYDRLMYDFDYVKITDYIERIFEKHYGSAAGKKPALVLDLGCGTGSITMEMAKRGYDMIAIDGSEEMLSVLAEKNQKFKINTLNLKYNIIDFELYGTVDAVICLTDTLNYIKDKNDIKKVFALVKNYLNPGGIFIFDINSEYKFENIFGDHIFYEIADDISYVWKCSYDHIARACEFDISLFIKDERDSHGRYERIDEFQIEHAYSENDMVRLLDKAGFSNIITYDDLSFKNVKSESQRIFFVCNKNNKS